MYERISQMEPLLPEKTNELWDMARELVGHSALLAGRLHPITQKTLIQLLRITNSYYSNRIEGHSTHPIDIERAMREDYDADPSKRTLQIESLAHIECQRLIEIKIAADNDINVASPEFLCWIHKIFYEQLPEDLRVVKNEATGEEERVIPGRLRKREVEVGRHICPVAPSLPAFMQRFSSVYESGSHHGLLPIIVAAASHHRLMWIHPFLDGNGRVTRLYTDACFLRLPLVGYGMWNVSRGLARKRDDYMTALASGDAHRQTDYDGRGNLSKGLSEFCKFFLKVCLDQTSYMQTLLQTDSLLDRVSGYIKLRSEGGIFDLKKIRTEAAPMLQEALLRGEVSRGNIISSSGLAERTGRNLLNNLLKDDLLLSDTPKGPVRLGLPTHLAQFLFPDLFPR